nr:MULTISPECIES: ABC transporter permease [unclassified Psychrosphaera]
MIDVALSFVPVSVVLFLMYRSKMPVTGPTISIARMLLQLMVVGYALLWVFQQASPLFITLLIFLMMLIASWLALNVVKTKTVVLFRHALISILIGSGLVLIFITQGVLRIEPWYNPQYLIPLGGMLFSSSMTAISLALERFVAELEYHTVASAKNIAIKAAMIPVINSMLAVGVVSLPGMMTGQILSGVEPYIAARYQILVMTMVFSATGLTVFVFMYLLAKTNLSYLKSKN